MLTSSMSPEAVTAALERIRDGRGAARLRRPRALLEPPLPRRDRRGRRRPPGGRRGPLPLGVGPRLPPRLPAAGRRAGASGLSADHRADGHGDAAGGGRHRDGAAAARPGHAADGLRSPQPHVRRRRRWPATATSRACSARLLHAPDALPAVVYCGRRRTCEEVADALSAGGLRASPYHAGLDSARRSATLTAFLAGELDVVCATTAFGMGIDKADVRSVVHWALPPSPEEYYQQAGRAGRDGCRRAARSSMHGATRASSSTSSTARKLDPDRPDRRASRLSPSGPTPAASSGCASEICRVDEPRVALAVLERAGALELFPAPCRHVPPAGSPTPGSRTPPSGRGGDRGHAASSASGGTG